MRKHSLLSLMLVVAVMALGVVFSPTQAEEDPLQEEVLSTPGETLEQSLAKAQAAATRSQMNVTVSAVGFDIPAGSEAEKYLQSTAQAGRGSYFPAKDARQLAAALGAAASGQTAATPSALVVGRKVVNDKLQGEADSLPTDQRTGVFLEFKGMPQKDAGQLCMEARRPRVWPAAAGGGPGERLVMVRHPDDSRRWLPGGEVECGDPIGIRGAGAQELHRWRTGRIGVNRCLLSLASYAV